METQVKSSQVQWQRIVLPPLTSPLHFHARLADAHRCSPRLLGDVQSALRQAMMLFMCQQIYITCTLGISTPWRSFKAVSSMRMATWYSPFSPKHCLKCSLILAWVRRTVNGPPRDPWALVWDPRDSSGVPEAQIPRGFNTGTQDGPKTLEDAPRCSRQKNT